MDSILLSNGIRVPAIGFGPGGCGYSARYRPPQGDVSYFLYRVYRKLVLHPRQAWHYVAAVASAIEQGFRLIDYSAAYGDGSLVGRGIRRSGVPLEELTLTTRVSNRAQVNGTIVEEFQQQLQGLGTDYVDILMFHWPVTGHYEQTWLQMVDLYRQGYCRMLGVANCHQHHLERLMEISDVVPAIDQFEVHPLFTQQPLIGFCREHGIQVEAYTPIARFDDRLMRLPKLQAIAQRYHKTVTQVVLRWHVQHGVIPVVRTLSAAHQRENLAIFDFQLTPEEMQVIDSVNINARVRYDPDNCDFSIL